MKEKDDKNKVLDQNESDLVQGIVKHAEIEAEKIIKDAEKAVEQRKSSVGVQLKQIKKEALKKLQQQTANIEKNHQATTNLECRRMSLRLRDQIVDEIQQKIIHGIEELINGKDYETTLQNWIIEGILGLQVKEVIVNASAPEIEIIKKKNILKKVQKKTIESFGLEVNIALSDDLPLLAQGVVLKSENGRMAFNNQLSTRLLRYQSNIRRMIYEELFND